MKAVDLMVLIRQRAYEIWEREGRPNNRDLVHWLRAEREIGKVRNTPLSPDKPKRKIKKKGV